MHHIQNRKLQHVEFHLLAIAKGHISGINSYSDLLNSLIEAFKVEYCDLTDRPAFAAKVFVQRWLDLDHHNDYFNLVEMLEKMEPDQLSILGFPNDATIPRERALWFKYDANYDAGLYGNWLKAIACNIGVLTTDQIPGFREWLVNEDNIPRHLSEAI